MRSLLYLLVFAILLFGKQKSYSYMVFRDDNYSVDLFLNISLLVSSNKIQKYKYTAFVFREPSLGMEVSKILSNSTTLSAIYDIYADEHNRIMNRQLYLQLLTSSMQKIKLGNFYAPFYQHMFSIRNRMIDQENNLDLDAKLYLTPIDNNILLLHHAVGYNIDLYPNINWGIAYQSRNQEQQLHNIISTSLQFLGNRKRIILGYQGYSYAPKVSLLRAHIISLSLHNNIDKFYITNINSVYANIKEFPSKYVFSQLFHVLYDMSDQINIYLAYYYLMDSDKNFAQSLWLMGSQYKVDQNLSFRIETIVGLRNKSDIIQAKFFPTKNSKVQITMKYVF